MDCPTCHSLNPDNALSCTMCGAVLIRREIATIQTVAEGPLIGTSYSAEPLATPMHLHARKATAFAATAMALDVVMALLIFCPQVIIGQFTAGGAEAAGHSVPLWATRGIFALLVVAWSIGKTGQAAGNGFWNGFLFSLVPPLIPAGLARIGRRSVLWTYCYLAIDALAIAAAVHFFAASPLVAILVLLVTVPFAAFHLTGCAMPQIAGAIGLSPLVATTWLCGGFFAFLAYGLIHTGMAEALINSLVGDATAPKAESLLGLLSPDIITGDYTAYCSFAFWCLGGWLFWLKSVYESLRYPMF